MATGQEPEDIRKLRVRSAAAILEHPLGEPARGFGQLRVVEKDKRLERGARGLAAHDTNVSFRGVERDHGRRRRSAFPEGVEAATIQAIAFVAFIMRARLFLPEPFGLIWFRRRSADFLNEQSTRGEGVVAQHFSSEPANGRSG